ncbi:hypothetical protein SteCoe_10396 [Stentor coeruleus]|uniref:WWE domain-containing protein n=1 Tax=Stentor coeruleus TaxID=5963 RepID=A0A1R2CFN1_9CILI|nr:hypothetical protein SteCoe_10396 [Stentor coeruleus]
MGCICGKKKKKNNNKNQKNPSDPSTQHISNLEPEPDIVLPEERHHTNSYPTFFTNDSLSGIWVYSKSEEDCQFSDGIQQTIETDFLVGKATSEFVMEGKTYMINFKESTLTSGDEIYPVVRTKLRKEEYGWMCDDGTIRPLLGNVEEMLQETEGKLKCKINGVAFNIDLPRLLITEIKTKVHREIQLL